MGFLVLWNVLLTLGFLALLFLQKQQSNIIGGIIELVGKMTAAFKSSLEAQSGVNSAVIKNLEMITDILSEGR